MLRNEIRKNWMTKQNNPIDKKWTGKSKSKLKALSFFSGAMGLDLGIEQAGIDVVLACEHDIACRNTIIANKPEIGLIGDIWKYSSDEIREYSGLSKDVDIDLMIGGPPCQSFSTAGKRKGLSDDRGNALLRYIQLITELRPRYAVIENVRGILSAELDGIKGGVLDVVLTKLRIARYGVSFNLYNSANFGTPQIRERVVILCSRDGIELPYLQPICSDNPKYNLPVWSTFRDATADLNSKECTHLVFPEKRIQYYKLLSEGQNWRSLPENLQKEALGGAYNSGGGKSGFLRRLAWDKPSPTLLTHPAMPATDLAHTVENSPLSIEEYKRIQQFPDDYKICGNLIQQYKQIGNAAPVGLGKAIGELILKYDNGEEIIDIADFQYSRYNNTNNKTWKL